MSFFSVVKFGLPLTAAAATAFAVSHKNIGEIQSKYIEPYFAQAATVEKQCGIWDHNWDRRNHTKPTATRHIILIRHGQYNLAGTTDEEKSLTCIGEKQSIFTGKRLKSMNLDKQISIIVHSTMARAIQTSQLIACELNLSEKNACIKATDLLREGAPIEPDPPVDHWVPEPQTFFVDGSRIETAFRQFIHRADEDQSDDSVELYVCHANIIRYFVCRALQLPPEAWLRMSLRHGSITQLSIKPNGRVALKALGDSGHLPVDKLTFE